jgi:bleomycin hydrolase
MPAKHELPRKVLDRAVQECGIRAVALKHDVVKGLNHSYKTRVPWARQPLAARDQARSGRCWIFAGNVALESKVLARDNKQVTLSASFVNYHALRKLSLGLLYRAARGKEVTAEDVQEISEGGFGAWYYDIVRTHGIVPQEKFPSTFGADHSGIYIGRLRNITSRAIQELQGVEGKDAGAKKKRAAIVKRARKDIIRQLDVALGRPPRRFTVDGKQYTPKTYVARYLGLKKDDLDYVMLSNDPITGFNRRYLVEDFPGMRTFEVHNVSKRVLQGAARKALRSGEAIYFSSIISRRNPHVAGISTYDPPEAKGVLSLRAYDYGRLLPSSSSRQSKRDRQKAGELRANHAMALVGHDKASGKWLVQNSHGDDSGDKGRLHMYNDFFTYYGSSIAVPRSMVPKAVLTKTQSRKPMESPRKRLRDL